MSPRPRIAGCIALIGSALLSDVALAQTDEPDGAPLRVEVRSAAVGNGRAAVPVVVSGGPSARAGELAEAPELPTLSCPDAATLPAAKDAPPAVLAPAADRARTLSCTARQRGAEATFELALRPPTAGLYGSATPPQAKAMGAPIAVRVFALGADGANPPANLRASASAGTIENRGPGELAIALPQNRAPRVIALAFTDGQQFGATFVPITGTAVLPVDTTRRAEVSVRVAGRWFGPVRARKKRVKVPIEVPPGVTRGVARATDRRNSSTETLVDLRTPDPPRLAAIGAVDELQANERTQIAIALASPSGRPHDASAQIVAEAQRGRVQGPQYVADGLWLLNYQAPDTAGEDEVTIRVEGDQPAGSTTVRLQVRPAPVEVPPPPPPETRELRFGAHAGLGWLDNFGDVSRPRVRAGVAVRTDLGPAEVGVQLLFEYTSLSDTVTTADEMLDVTRSLHMLTVPVQAHARMRLWGPIGATVGLALMPVYARVSLESPSQPIQRAWSLLLAQRAELSVDVELALGRLSLAAGVGRARAPEGPVLGNLERITVTAGYELRFATWSL